MARHFLLLGKKTFLYVSKLRFLWCQPEDRNGTAPPPDTVTPVVMATANGHAPVAASPVPQALKTPSVTSKPRVNVCKCFDDSALSCLLSKAFVAITWLFFMYGP